MRVEVTLQYWEFSWELILFRNNGYKLLIKVSKKLTFDGLDWEERELKIFSDRFIWLSHQVAVMI